MDVLENLAKGEIYTFIDESIREVEYLIKKSVGEYAIIKGNDEGVSVVRISTDNLQEIVFSICNDIDVFDFQEVSGNYEYVRILVNKYNKYKDTNILAISRNGRVYIYKDADVESDPSPEIKESFNRWKLKATEIWEKLEHDKKRMTTKRDKILKICETINPFESVEIDCSYNYAVAVVSEQSNRDIKAVKENGVVCIKRKFDMFKTNDLEYIKKSEIGFSQLIGEEPQEIIDDEPLM